MHTSFFSVVVTARYTTLPRFTVVISNKLVNIAPKRARIKRRMRAMIKVVFLNNSIPAQYDCVFLAQPTVEKASWEQLVAAGQDVFARMHHLVTTKNDSFVSKTNLT